MKRIFVFLAIASMAVFVSCDILGGDDDNVTESYELVQTTTSTETAAAFDDVYFGLYKGIIAGPRLSGTFKVEVNNGNDEVKAFITVGNKTDELTYTRALIQNENTYGDEYIYPAPLPLHTENVSVDIFFTGTFSSFELNIYSYGNPDDGINWNINVSRLNVDGHDYLPTNVEKEKSDQVIYCFEGTSVDSQGNQGVFNMIHTYGFDFILCGEGEGMYITSIFQSNISEGLSTKSTDVFFDWENDVRREIDSELEITAISSNTISGIWKTQWPGGSNNGTFRCDVPLRIINY